MKNRHSTPSLIAIAIAVSQALLLEPIQAAIIDVDPQGTPAGCTIREAIRTANSDEFRAFCVNGHGPDTTNLPANSSFTYIQGNYLSSGGVALLDRGKIRIENSTISRNTALTSIGGGTSTDVSGGSAIIVNRHNIRVFWSVGWWHILAK